MDLASLRSEYQGTPLNEFDVSPDPLTQFQTWFDQSIRADLPMANAMTLSTVSADGQPTARVVLLKGLSDGGFVFFTNYSSRKGRELVANPKASLLFYWPELQRQIRVDGRIVKVSAEESEEYFGQRPLGSRHAAIASAQSERLATRTELEAAYEASVAQHGDQPPRPPHWGGYRLTPSAMEFWQGRPNRLHDRLLYSRNGSSWMLNRLSP